MKKLFSLLVIATMITAFWSCKDDETTPDGPSLAAPGSITNVRLETDVDVSFDIEVPGGYMSASVTALGGTAVVKSEPAAGAKTGTVVVTYSAGSNTGAGSISLTVVDKNNKEATTLAVISVNDFDTIDVNFNISTNTTWETGKVYILRGRITVLSGVTLTIQAGVIVKGDEGTDSNAKALIIARGGKLNVAGTAAQPVIFTSILDEIRPGQIESPNMDPEDNGKWGGVIILGKAKISGSAAELQIEGIPTSDTNGLYGGTDDADNSGTIKYISIRHGGTLIGSGNEINGLTLGGVGSGTVIENVEIVGNQDDGIEFFGGTVSVKNVLVWTCFDDGLDTDQAWNGTVDNFVIIAPNTGSAFELDGPEGAYLNGNHKFINGTVYAGANIADLIDFDANSNVEMSNIYFFGFGNGTSVKEYSAMVNFAGSTSSVTDFEYTLTGATNPDPAVVFLDIPAGELSAVTVNANTIGADTSVFNDWTLADVSGMLASIGL